jgi:cyclopropane-fatty-acyl-phospholipid synthase
MTAKQSVEKIAELLEVTINGQNPSDPQIYDERVYDIFLSRNSLAVGESFMAKWWDCDDLSDLFSRLISKKLLLKKSVLSDPTLFARAIFSNLQSRAKAFEVGEMHYDLGNDLYETMLDKRMIYTAAIWEGAETLDAAQEKKLERICRKLELKPGDRVLDIGCGWGGFMKYAVEKYQVTCVGLTVSKEQAAFGREQCHGLPIEFVISDYRDYKTDVPFDHVVSIEMIEAVGSKNLRVYFEKAHELLKPRGGFFLQAIIDRNAKPVADPWIDKYIFRNGVLVSHAQLVKETQNLFIFEDIKDIGKDYDRTLMAWFANFDRNYEELRSHNPKYDERFYRMWKYYLHSCAALFRTEAAQDFQILLRKV